MSKYIIICFLILMSAGCSSKKEPEPVNLAELGLVKTGTSADSADKSAFSENVHNVRRESCPASVSVSTIEINGTVLYRIKGNFLTLSADGIVNNWNEWSGVLFLKLWATDSPYPGGEIRGYVVGTARIGRLRGGDYIQNIETEVPYLEPPLGTYYLTMTLTEQKQDSEVITDYMTFPNAETLGR